MIKHYVLGFAFSNDKQNVLLIKKKHPDWQAGKINGIGGIIEINEIDYNSINRKLYEETGIESNKENPIHWDHFITLESKSWKVFCFRCFTDRIYEAKQITDEIPLILFVNDININGKFVESAVGLIDLALQTTISGRIFYAS